MSTKPLTAILLLLLIRSAPVLADYPPDVLTYLDTGRSVNGLATDGADRVYYTDGIEVHKLLPALGELASWSGLVCSPFGVAANPQAVFVSDGFGGGTCPVYKIQKFSTNGNFLGWWCSENSNCASGYLFLDGEDLYATYMNRIMRFDTEGRLLASWESDSNLDLRRMALGKDGDLYVAEFQGNQILRFDPDLTGYEVYIPNGTDEQSVTGPRGVAFDPDGDLYVIDRGRDLIRKFDSHGRLLTEWEQDDMTGAVTVDSEGYLYVGLTSRLVKFDNKAGSPPEEALPPHPAAIFLHVGKASGKRLACDEMPRSPSQVVTQGSADPSGNSRYYVYLLGSPQTLGVENAGITGMQMGIRFTGTSETDPRITVFGWTPCSIMNFPQDGWPASGTGNTITWTVNPTTCQQEEMVLAGFMYVSAYAPAIVAVTGFPTADPENPSNGLAKVTDCGGAEIVVDPSRLAWVSFGGAKMGGDAVGCNPLYGPCQEALAPVLPTTWGRIKTKYAVDPH